MSKINESKGLSWVITFGKYKGDTLKDVIINDPQLIRWYITNIGWFDVDDEASEFLDHWMSEMYHNEDYPEMEEWECY